MIKRRINNMLYFDYQGYDDKIGREAFFNRKPITINRRSYNINIMEGLVEEKPKVLNNNKNFEGEIVNVQERQINIWKAYDNRKFNDKNLEEIFSSSKNKGKNLIRNIEPVNTEEEMLRNNNIKNSLGPYISEKKDFKNKFSLGYQKGIGFEFRDFHNKEYDSEGNIIMEKKEDYKNLEFEGN